MWCWRRLLRVPWSARRSNQSIQPVHPKGDLSWVFIGRTDVEAETPVLWPLDAKSWPIWVDPDAGKDWGQEEKGTAEDEMVGWHHWLDGHESEWTPGVGDGQGGLVCCSSWGRQESDVTEQLDWTEVFFDAVDSFLLFGWITAGMVWRHPSGISPPLVTVPVRILCGSAPFSPFLCLFLKSWCSSDILVLFYAHHES